MCEAITELLKCLDQNLLPVKLAVRFSYPLHRRLVAAPQAVVEVNQDIVHLHVLVQGEPQVPADTRHRSLLIQDAIHVVLDVLT